jgi:serine/threonine protein kinase
LTCPHGHQWDAPAGGEDPALCPICGALSQAAPGSGEPAPVTDEGKTLPYLTPLAMDSAEAPSTLPRPESPTELADLERIRVKGYEILGELGRGGMGVVYRARQVSLKRIVALKMVLASAHAGPNELARFRTEAEAVARLQHPHIVQIYEVGEEDGCPYFSLEFVDGVTLAQKLGGKPLPALQAAQLAETLARAVHAAHQRGIIHRDLKPANILLTADGVPKITDFGLAKSFGGETYSGPSGPDSAPVAEGASLSPPSSPRTETGAILGTPSYMAPEQAGGKKRDIGPATDVYSLGAILYEMLTGRPPFRAETPLDTVMLVVSEEPLPLRKIDAAVPRDLETICLKCLEKDPGKRYASAEALAGDLERYLNGEPILARPLSPVGRLLRWARRQPAFATTLIALAVFYLNHLLCLFVFEVPGEGGRFHWFVTGLMACWALGAGFFQWLIRRPGWEVPARFGWASMDVFLFTLLLLNGDGPRSSLLVGYLLLIGGAALRFHIILVWFATGICMASYLALVLDAMNYRPEVAVPPHVAFIFLLNLGIMGLIFHLVLRRVRTPGPTLTVNTPPGEGRQPASANRTTAATRKKG